MLERSTTSIHPEFKHFTKNRELVFFLGAGFSADIGLPIMKKFGEFSALEHEYLLREDPSVKPAVRTFLDAYGFYDDLKTFVKKANKYIDIDPDNFEDLFCVAESYLNSGILAQAFSSGVRDMKDLYRHIGFWLWDIYKQCPPLDERKNKKGEGLIYENFFDFLKKKALNKMAIITTNYDLICEYYMNKRGFNVAYPIPKSIFKDVCLCTHRNYYIDSKTTFNSVPLCKLHGSINYFETDSSFFLSRELAEKDEYIGGSPAPDRRPAMFPLDALSKVRAALNPLSGFEIGIVPPTYAKLDNKKWMRYIWNGAFELIRKAKKIVFIGYSFPASDGFMKAMFQGALSLRNDDDDLEVVVVDKCKDVLKKYKEEYFVGSKSIELFEGRFIDVWRKGELKTRLV